MRKSGFLALLAVGMFATCAAQAQQQPWIVKGGVGYLMPKSNPGTIDLGTGNLDAEFDDAVGAIFSVGYMFDEHWAGELYVGAPFQSDIDVEGAGQAQADQVPLTISALYYFNPNGRWRPYLGAGINFTEFFSEKPNQLHLGGSIGPAATAGIDYLFTRHWFATLDLRWTYVETEVQANGSQQDFGHLQLNPLIAGLMVGYRFGGRRPPEFVAPPPPAAAPVVAAAPVAARCSDQDGDGVCDADDKCPNTPAGDRVGPFGCSCDLVIRTHFAFDSAVLTAEDRATLDGVAARLKELQFVEGTATGHTDNIGTAEYNQGLSERRAQAVVDYLASKGVYPGRIKPIGMGLTRPIADNATEEGRAANRRVTIRRTDCGPAE
jgi:OOP family OmpA-OmpF porin